MKAKVKLRHQVSFKNSPPDPWNDFATIIRRRGDPSPQLSYKNYPSGVYIRRKYWKSELFL